MTNPTPPAAASDFALAQAFREVCAQQPHARISWIISKIEARAAEIDATQSAQPSGVAGDGMVGRKAEVVRGSNKGWIGTIRSQEVVCGYTTYTVDFDGVVIPEIPGTALWLHPPIAPPIARQGGGDAYELLRRADIEMRDEIRGGNFKGYELECLKSWSSAIKAALTSKAEGGNAQLNDAYGAGPKMLPESECVTTADVQGYVTSKDSPDPVPSKNKAIDHLIDVVHGAAVKHAHFREVNGFDVDYRRCISTGLFSAANRGLLSLNMPTEATPPAHVAGSGMGDCPFCGCEAMVGGGGDHNVMCTNCPASMVGDTEAEAIAAWNARILTAQPAPADPWRNAVLDHLCVVAIDAPTDEPPYKTIGRIIDLHVAIATDPAVNGGLSLQPAPVVGGSSSCAVEYDRDSIAGMLDHYSCMDFISHDKGFVEEQARLLRSAHKRESK